MGNIVIFSFSFEVFLQYYADERTF